MRDQEKLPSDYLPPLTEEDYARILEAERTTGSHALAKALRDPFDYALKLRTGEVIRFHTAELLNSEWVHLNLGEFLDQPEKDGLAYPAERGVDVRLADIVWVMDAPEGS